MMQAPTIYTFRPDLAIIAKEKARIEHAASVENALEHIALYNKAYIMHKSIKNYFLRDTLQRMAFEYAQAYTIGLCIKLNERSIERYNKLIEQDVLDDQDVYNMSVQKHALQRDIRDYKYKLYAALEAYYKRRKEVYALLA